MNPPEEYTHQPAESADANLASFTSLFTHVASVFIASFLIVCLAIVFPWKGGAVPNSFAILFYLTVAVSVYAFARGYSEIVKRGFAGWGFFAWCAAILVTVGVSTNIILFGSSVIDSLIVFPGSGIITAPVVFLALVICQALYFLAESVIVSLSHTNGARCVENWYLAIYLFILSMNSAAVFTGLIILGYYRVLW